MPIDDNGQIICGCRYFKECTHDEETKRNTTSSILPCPACYGQLYFCPTCSTKGWVKNYHWDYESEDQLPCKCIMDEDSEVTE